MSKKDSEPEDIDYLQDLALVMAVKCVRNTIIEQYHVDGKLTEKEMEAFNREVADNIYTFLYFDIGPAPSQEDRKHFLEMMFEYYPINWNRPKLKMRTFDDLEIKKGTPKGQKLLKDWAEKIENRQRVQN